MNPRPFHSLAWWAVAIIALLLCACGHAAPESALPEPPHAVIVIDIDTLRADHLGLYGYSRDTSPHIDALGSSSVVFDWAFSQAPNTPPSQTSIFTSLYPSTHGMIHDEDRVPQSATTLAEAFSAGGYATAGFVDGGYMAAKFGHDQGFDVYHENPTRGLETLYPVARTWLRENHQRPFFLLIHTYDVHTPYSPPPPFDQQFTASLAEPPTEGFEPTPKVMEGIRKANHPWNDLQPRSLPAHDLAYTVALYDGGIAYVDSWVEEFLEELSALDLLERSVLVVLSDHGEEFQEHGSVLHEKLYATVTHVPFLLRLPGGHHAARIDRVVEMIDVMPTLLELSRLPIPEMAQGRSLVPFFAKVDREADRRELAISESPFFGVRRALTTRQHRVLFTRETETSEVYAYRDDPLEQEDLDGSPTVASETQTVHRILERWTQRVLADRERLDQGHDAPRPDPPLDPETKRQLEALGYTD